MCDSENGVPAAWPWAVQSTGVTSSSRSSEAPKPSSPRRSSSASRLSRYRGPRRCQASADGPVVVLGHGART
ncbi:hypothetical protein DT87_24365 [Streptomyces sp. NTK 937]|nr:hypothetical protein DT87_24365 [Streptomyces sp. NTK 937]